jgi:hypothetical protein
MCCGNHQVPQTCGCSWKLLSPVCNTWPPVLGVKQSNIFLVSLLLFICVPLKFLHLIIHLVLLINPTSSHDANVIEPAISIVYLTRCKHAEGSLPCARTYSLLKYCTYTALPPPLFTYSHVCTDAQSACLQAHTNTHKYEDEYIQTRTLQHVHAQTQAHLYAHTRTHTHTHTHT